MPTANKATTNRVILYSRLGISTDRLIITMAITNRVRAGVRKLRSDGGLRVSVGIELKLAVVAADMVLSETERWGILEIG